MKLQKVQRELSKYKNGTFFYMTWESSLPIKAKFKDKYVVTKIVRSQVRKGIKYTHTKQAIEKWVDNNINNLPTNFSTKTSTNTSKENIVATIQRDKNKDNYLTTSPLAWGKWKEQGLILEHTNKKGEYKTYVRLYSVPYHKGAINSTQVKYFLNGKLISKSELQRLGIVNDSYWEDREMNLFNLCTDNIISIGK